MSKGVTLIELIVVVALIMIISGAAIFSLGSASTASDISTSKAIVVGALEQAETNSRAVLGGLAYGVHLEKERVVIYADSGGGYNPNNTNNQVKLLGKGVALSWNLNEVGDNIFFGKLTGEATNFGEVTISSGPENIQININSLGTIDY